MFWGGGRGRGGEGGVVMVRVVEVLGLHAWLTEGV